MMKAFSSTYPLYELTFFRSIVAILVCLFVFLPLEGGIKILKTKSPGIHFFRGSCVVVANIAFFAGIAVLPLAEATAIFFISPILITFFSIIFLKEKVGILRWSALIFGLLGIILVIKPFGASFGASWIIFGFQVEVFRISWEPLGGSWKGLVSLLDASWDLFGGFVVL